MPTKKPIITAEQIKAGVQKNASEYTTRLETMRAMMREKTYNPPVDPTILNAAANEASRGAMGSGPALPVYNQGGVIGGDVRMGRADPEAQSMAKTDGKRGGRRGKKEADDEEGQGPEDGKGNGGVQAGQASFGQQARPQSPFAQAGHSDSTSPVWIEQSWEAESKEAVMALVPAGSKGIEVRRVWKATALVRQG